MENKNNTIDFTYINIRIDAEIIQQRYPISYEKCNHFFWIKKCERAETTAARKLTLDDIDRIHKALFGKAYLEVRKKIKALEIQSSDFSFLSK